MKRELTLFSALCIFLLASNANALNSQGFVSIYQTPTYEYMYGTFNVQFNPRPGHANSYIRTSHSPLHSIVFSGYDAVNNTTFSCSVSDWGTPELLEMARNIASSVGDGTYLYVRRMVGEQGCNYLYVSKPSYYQH